MELNHLLSNMASEGTVESSGVFTMDFAYAERKLDDYRLPDPALFILNLVASAVLSGSHQFVVETERGETRVFFNGALPDPERLPELFTFILKPAPHPALRELALALHGARSLPGDPKISLWAGTKTGGWQAQVNGARLDVEPAPSDRLGIKVTVQHSSSSPWARLLALGQASASQKILEQLFHFCRYAPLDLRVNGQPKGSAIPMGLHQTEGPFARLFARGSQQLRISRPGSRRQDVFFAPDRSSPVASSILVGLALPHVAEREDLLFICRGVAFRRPGALLGNPLACAVVSADHLEKNLSQTDLVENEDFRQLVAAVRLQVESLMEEVCVKPPLWSAEQARALRQLLQERYPADQRPPAVDMFFRVQELNQNFASPEQAQQQVDYYLALSAEERSGASNFREQMQAILKTRVLQTVDHKRWSTAHLFLEQLARVGKPARIEFRMLICFFAEDLETALRLDQADGQDPTLTRLLLRYIWGWRDQPPSQSALSRFFVMERAFHQGDERQAVELAGQLAQLTFTPFLGLWLGWYALHRKEYRVAEELWFHVLARVSPALYKLWYPRMWRHLSGKIPLAAQIRWQARQGIRRYLTPGKEADRLELHEDQGLFEWTQTVWLLRAEENPEAHPVFLRYLLRYLLVPEKFSIEPFSSPQLAVALPTS